MAILHYLGETDEQKRLYRTGPTYAPIADFLDGAAWSLVVRFRGEPDSEGRVEADVEFLSADAPATTGAQFHLLEGHCVVATGEIVEVEST